MAQFPGYLRRDVRSAARSQPSSLLDIVGALGPARPAPARAADATPTARDRRPARPAGVATARRRGVGAPGHG